MDTLWQFSLSSAFKTGLYGGWLTIADLKRRGSFGVGEFENLDGELIATDGVFHRATSDGKVVVADDADRLCFAQVGDFRPGRTLDAPPDLTDATIGAFLEPVLGTRNVLYALQIDGLFKSVTATAYHPQARPFRPYSAVLQDASAVATFQFTGQTGRIVALDSPAYYRDIGVKGYHFHYVSQGGDGGGHVTSFTLAQGTISIAEVDRLALIVPTDDEFRRAKINLS